jgi:hypothetical protein
LFRFVVALGTKLPSQSSSFSLLILLRAAWNRPSAGHLPRATGLEHDALQLFEYGRGTVGLKMSLVPDFRRSDEAAVGQAPQLSLYCAGAGLRQLDELVGEETAVGLTKEQRQQTLLSRRKERIDQTCPTVSIAGRMDY